MLDKQLLERIYSVFIGNGLPSNIPSNSIQSLEFALTQIPTFISDNATVLNNLVTRIELLRKNEQRIQGFNVSDELTRIVNQLQEKIAAYFLVQDTNLPVSMPIEPQIVEPPSVEPAGSHSTDDLLKLIEKLELELQQSTNIHNILKGQIEEKDQIIKLLEMQKVSVDSEKPSNIPAVLPASMIKG